MIKELTFIANVKANINRKSKGASQDYRVVRGAYKHVGDNEVRQDTIIYQSLDAGTVQFVRSRKTGDVEVIIHRGSCVHIGEALWWAIEDAYKSEDATFHVSRRVN